MQRWSDVTRDWPDFVAEGTMVTQHIQDYLQLFKPNQQFSLGVEFVGTWLGSLGSTVYYENWQFTFPVKIDTLKVDSSKNPVESAFKSLSSYDFTNSYAYKLAATVASPPVYTV